MFIDEVTITIKAGRGGDGCVSFRREKFVPKGGPDGGDGGDGGDVVAVADRNRRTLLAFRHQNRYAAGSGEAGMGKQMFGRHGGDVTLTVPCGTVVRELPDGPVVADLVEHGARVVLARGGKGGKGNVHFKSSVRRVPRIATDGTEGEERSLKLTLKLLADVGLVGLPNVGKSTLLARISNATPRIGDFPFTTLRPNLGIAPVAEHDALVVADLPGLIEGAHAGRGLGTRFLKHVERSRVLLLVIDAASQNPREDLAVLTRELGSWSPALLERPRVVAYSRADLARGRRLPRLQGDAAPRFSAHTGEGIPELLRRLAAEVRDLEQREGTTRAVLDDLEREEADAGAGGAVPAPDLCFLDRLCAGMGLGSYPWPRRAFTEVGEGIGGR